MRPNWRSSGVATAEAIVSGLAPGSPALTEMVGNSTSGSGATGSLVYAKAPASNTAMLSSDVPTGRLMNGVEILMRKTAVGDKQQAIGCSGGGGRTYCDCESPIAYCLLLIPSKSICS